MLLNFKKNTICILALTSLFLCSCRDYKSIETLKPMNTASNIKEKTVFYAPYTGEVIDEKTSKNAAIMAIIENSNAARPQSGLVDADIVYETMAEGGIPRFIALFQKNTPPLIGPIRSARPYFINIAQEYNLPFAHCGYSDEAKAMIEKEKLLLLEDF